MTSTELAARENGVALPLARLDPYAGGLSDEQPQVDALAVISCGYRGPDQGNKPGLPRASRANDPQQIHLHDPLGRAPGLKAAVEAGDHRQLLIAFPLDDPAQFIIQRFTRYSATRLEVYGDAAALHVIEPDKHREVRAGTPEYDRLVRTCKADTRIYFCLAEWTSNGPEVVFPDGLGVYAIRTTSRHSVRSILGPLAYTARFTRGHIAGLPFLLSVDHREVAGPDGFKRNIPVWTITTKPPEGARLSSRTFREIATSALREGAALMLPAPTAPDWEDYQAEGPADIEDPTPAEVQQLEAGGLCDYSHWLKTWHALARGTAWDNDAARAAFLESFTDGTTNSLSEFLQHASERDAAALIAAFGSALSNARQQHLASEYDRLIGEPTEHDTLPRVRDETPQAAATAPRPSNKAQKQVTSINDRYYQRYSELAEEAAELDIGFEVLELPVSVEYITERGRDLTERIAAARAKQQPAEEEAF